MKNELIYSFLRPLSSHGKDMPRLLRYGKFFDDVAIPHSNPIVANWLSKNKTPETFCFWNCQRFKADNPHTGIYYEGYVLHEWNHGLVQLLGHAWIVIAGRVFDLTYSVSPDVKATYLGLPFKTKPVPLTPCPRYNLLTDTAEDVWSVLDDSELASHLNMY